MALLLNTKEPVPVSVVTAAAKLALVGVARNVATPVPSPETPVLIGSPVAFVSVADEGVPSAGVTNVGLVANTSAPEPVSSVTAAAKLALEGVPRNVATPVPRLVIPVPPFATGSVPVTPVVRGKPVAFVNVAEAGVPNAGVTSVGLVANTKAPEPVSSVTAAAKFALEGVPRNVATPVPKLVMPVPPFATGSVPVTPVVSGRPVALVKVAEAGVPSAGVTRVGLVAKTKEPVPVSSDTAAARFALLGVPRNVATPVPRLVMPVPPFATGKVPVTPVVRGSPVALVRVAEAGVPSAGVTNVGLVANTKEPVPVSSVTAAAKFALLGVPRNVATPEPKPVMLASEMVVAETITKSEPSHATRALTPFATVTPVVGVAPRMTTPYPPVVALTTIYALLRAGAVIIFADVRAPVQSRIACRAWLATP